jgi:hypothetical protein
MPRQFDKEASPEQLAALSDDDIDTIDIPDLDERFWERAKLDQPSFIAELEAAIDVGLKSGPSEPMEPMSVLIARFRKNLK